MIAVPGLLRPKKTVMPLLLSSTTRPIAFHLIAILSFFIAAVTVTAVQPPLSLDDDWKIERVTAEPELVTPTGCCLDDSGRLLVIECHTHFPPDDYDGPKTDRVYLFDDTDGDGTVDRKRLFYEGGQATMNIANLGDGSFALASRSQVVRIRDTDGDDVADQQQVLLTHKTTATYPHNGLGGLTFRDDGWLYVGQGENFGEPYELIGTDGSKQVGGGEGGNIFRCRADGSRLQRIATGFWNPFGICVDSSKRLWSVGNDPDAMPPNRLMHVASGGDFGFQFRFGRAGIHPLQCWNGELPATLPMAGATGEAACAVAILDQHLWVTSWGDNRIERHTLQPQGASWRTKSEVVVQGGASFRPVGMAVAGNDSIYVTDWVDRSYPVHGKGRLWKLYRNPDATKDKSKVPERTPAELEASRLQLGSDVTADQRLRALGVDDPYIRQAAAAGLHHFNQLESVDRSQATSPRQRTGLLAAWRWRELSDPPGVSEAQRNSWIDWGMQDTSEATVITALRWATERGSKQHLGAIRALLDRDNLSPRLFSAVIASIAYLETGSASGKKRDPAIEKLLVEFAGNADRPQKLRGLAIRRIPAESKSPSNQVLSRWLDRQRDRSFAKEVVALLGARGDDTATDLLADIASDDRFDVQTRADALAGLSRKAGQYAAVVHTTSLPRQPEVLKQEAKRIRNRTWVAGKENRPRKDDLAAWHKRVGSGGDRQAGRRVFFRTTCANCHKHSGRGATTGPDLTTLSGQMSSQRVIESILDPSKEVGPLYVPWRILTVDGAVLTGLKLDKSGVGNQLRFQGADGNLFDVELKEIESQQPIAQSIMPTGLEDAMTLDELRDLIAFLTGN